MLYNPVSKCNSKTAIIAVSSVGLTRRAKSMKLFSRNNGFYSILNDIN